MTTEKFLKIHIADCEGCDAIMGSKIQQFIIEKRKKILTGREMFKNSNLTVPKLNKKNNASILKYKPLNEPLSMSSSLDSSLNFTINTGEVAIEKWKGRINDNINGFGLNMNSNNTEADFSLPVIKDDCSNEPEEIYTVSPIGHSSLLIDEGFCFDKNYDSATYNYPFESAVSLDHSYCHIDSQKSSNISVTTSPEIHSPKKVYIIKKVEKSPSFHFRPCPEINLMTRSTHRNIRKKQLVLENGNILESVHIKEMYLFIQNTCGFDSFVQILYSAALDDILYWNYISNSSVKILQFVKKFSLSTASDLSATKIYFERAKILMEHFDTKKNNEYPEPSRIHTLNAFSFMMDLWVKLFLSDPSAFVEYNCSNPECKRPSKTLNFLDVQWGKVRNSDTKKLDFTNLQGALTLTSHQKDKECGYENCRGIITNEQITGNRQIVIDVDVRDPTNLNRSLPCSLEDFPRFLELDTKYRCVLLSLLFNN